MQSESWKEPILKLSVDELKQAQSLIAELLQTLETQQESKEEPIEVFPPEKNVNIEEQRSDKRFDIEIQGVCSIVKREDSETVEEIPICIKDISKHGMRFVIDQPLIPSSILIIKFYLAPAKTTTGQFYKNPQKKIYAEVMRVLEFPTATGVKYGIGAKSIESERVVESFKEEENCARINKLLAMKGDVKILIVLIKEAQSKHLEELLLKQGYTVYRTNQKQQAVAFLRKNKCNLVISDMQTAGINEFELLKDIRGEFPGIKLLVEIDAIKDWSAILPLGVDDYLTKNFDDKEFNIILELLHKKLLYKAVFGDSFGTRRFNSQNILVLSGNEMLRKYFRDVSRERNLKLYLTSDTKYANLVLKRYKIGFIFVDTEFTGLEGCKFLAEVKKELPNIGIAVISKNLQERCDFLISGADNFIIESIDMQTILTILG